MVNLYKWAIAGHLFYGIMCSPCLFAADLIDPTMPSVNYEEVPGNGKSKEGARNAEHTGPVLQAILIAKQRRIAIISQQPVMMGGHIGEFEIKDIDLNGVTLEGPQGKRLLKLLPIEEFKAFKRSEEKAGSAS